MTGFKPGYLQALCTVLLLVNELPMDLTRFRAVAFPPNAIKHVPSRGPSEIPDLEPARCEIPLSSRSSDTPPHREDQLSGAKENIEGKLQVDGILSPDSHELLERPSQDGDGSVDSLNEPSASDMEIQRDTDREKPDSLAKQPVSTSRNQNTESRRVDHGKKLEQLHKAEELPGAAENVGQSTDYPHLTSHNRYNPDGGHPWPTSQYRLSEVHPGYPSVPNHNDYRVRPVRDQSTLHYQLHYYDVWAPIPAYQLHRAYAYLPVPKDGPFSSTVPPVYDQSYAHPGLLHPTHDTSFQVDYGHTLPARAQAMGDSSTLGRFPDHKSSSKSFPSRFKQPNKGMYQRNKSAPLWRTKDQASSSTSLSTEKAPGSSSSETWSTTGESSDTLEFPKESLQLSPSSWSMSQHEPKTNQENAEIEDKLHPGSPRSVDIESTSGTHGTLGKAKEASQYNSFTPEVHYRPTEYSKKTTNDPDQVPRIMPSELEKESTRRQNLKSSQGFPKDLDISKGKELASPEKVPSASESNAGDSSHDRTTLENVNTQEVSERGSIQEATERVEQVPHGQALPPRLEPKNEGSSQSFEGKPTDVRTAAAKLDVISNQKNDVLGMRSSFSADRSRDVVKLVQKNRFEVLDKVDPSAAYDEKLEAAEKRPKSAEKHPETAVAQSKPAVEPPKVAEEHHRAAEEHTRAAERLAESENPENAGSTAHQRTSDSERVAVASRGTYDPRIILDSARPYLKSKVKLVFDAWDKVPSLRSSVPSIQFPKLSRQAFIRKVVEHSPSLPSGTSLLNFVTNSKSKFGNMIGRRIGYNSHSVPHAVKEDPTQIISTEEPKNIKRIDASQSSRFSPTPSLKSLDSKSYKSPTTPRREETPQFSDEVSESRNGRPGLNVDNFIDGRPSLSSRNRKRLRYAKLKSKEDMPSYVQEYIAQNAGSRHQEIELLRVLGKYMKADIVGRYTPVYLDEKAAHVNKEAVHLIQEAGNSEKHAVLSDEKVGDFNKEDPDLEAMNEYIVKMHDGNFGGKQWKWLTEKIGEVEGKRRWKALIRQFNQPRILLGFGGFKRLAPYWKIARLGRVLKLGELWPTFYDAKYADYWWLTEALRNPSLKIILIDILGKEELAYRMNNIFVMARRVYPRNWLDPSDLRTAYQQGLDTTRIVIIGDFLQFGSSYLSLEGKHGVATFRRVYFLLSAIWEASPSNPWGTSAEKTWLLRDPHREKLYNDRFELLKHKWKYDMKLSPEQLADIHPELQQELTQKEKLSSVWWNPSDVLEWREYQMDLLTMARIGMELKIPKERNLEIDLEELEKILEKKKEVSKEMKQIIQDWFKNNANSPYNDPIYLGSEGIPPPPTFLGALSDVRDFLSVCWHQRTFSPSDHPLFMSELK
ncbi:hypothetical protein PGTUg99_006435 [Puccinia graminis f. sp. tritici]|uniref:Uncharacterized protein n=1 Tax=Puccinia graminis f. sp. tritici TaxID=56615 RepID=A0A5B0QGD4_PUCGR|nr:hypothetical protein PGTUg99_006435 [Puccinia graminis f. sp. tritici]